MEIIADILMIAGAIGAGFYCFVLGRRLNRFNDLEKGVGGAVAVLSAQVDDLTKTLSAAQQTASKSAETLTELTARAEDTSRCLELQMASLHDIPSTYEPTPPHPQTPATKTSPVATSEPMFVRHRTTGDAA